MNIEDLDIKHAVYAARDIREHATIPEHPVFLVRFKNSELNTVEPTGCLSADLDLNRLTS